MFKFFNNETPEPELFSDVLAELGGVSKSADFNTIITAGKQQLFNFTYLIPATVKSDFETFVCMWYITRRISSANLKKWKAWFTAKILEIMPYYGKLMQTELEVFEPLLNVDMTTDSDTTGTRDTTTDGTENGSNSFNESGNFSTSGHKSNVHLDRFSDTPQGDSSRVWEITYDEHGNPIANLTDYYITDVRGITDNENHSDSGTDGKNHSGTDAKATHGVLDEDTTNYNLSHSKGTNGKSYSELMNEYRTTFLRIYSDIVTELEPLFYTLVENDDFMDFV